MLLVSEFLNHFVIASELFESKSIVCVFATIGTQG